MTDKKENATEVNKFFENFLNLYENTSLEPIVGRKIEVQRCILTLNKMLKNNVVLVGEAGVGKSTVVKEVARSLTGSNLQINNFKVLELKTNEIFNLFSNKFEYLRFLEDLFKYISLKQNHIIFVDLTNSLKEVNMELAKLLFIFLEKLNLRKIISTSFEGKMILKNFFPNVEKDFEFLLVNPLNHFETLEILKLVSAKYKDNLNIHIDEENLHHIVSLADEFIEGSLPAKALGLLDESYSFANFSKSNEGTEILDVINKDEEKREKFTIEKKFEEASNIKTLIEQKKERLNALDFQNKSKFPYNLSIEEILTVIEGIKGFKIGKNQVKQVDRYIKLKNVLLKTVLGQEEVIEDIANILIIEKSKKALKRRNLASFLFLGLSGVGKNKLAREISKNLFLDPSAYFKKELIDFSGLQKENKFGNEYLVDEILTFVLKNPNSLLYIDNLEKADPNLLEFFSKVLENGYWVDKIERKVDFTGVIFVFTTSIVNEMLLSERLENEVLSTASSEKIEDSLIKFNESNGDAFNLNSRFVAIEKIHSFFPKNLVKNIGNIFFFKNLEEPELKKIIKIELQNYINDLVQTNVKLIVSKSALEELCSLVQTAYNGAKSIEAIFKIYIYNTALAEELLKKTKTEISEFKIDFASGIFKLKYF